MRWWLGGKYYCMTIRSLADLLADIPAQLPEERVSIDTLLLAFHERGFGFLLLLFAMPMALPIPVPPGINVILASPLILLTAQQAIGRHTIWLPQFIRQKTLSRAKFDGLINGIIPWMRRIELLIRPRFGFVTQGFFSLLIGTAGFIMALSICVPLPLTNTIPSFGIALMAIGVLMRDGLAVLTGMTIGLAWVALLTGFLIFAGTEGLDILKETIKSWL